MPALALFLSAQALRNEIVLPRRPPVPTPRRRSRQARPALPWRHEIHAIAEDIAVLDDNVALVDADAELNPLPWWRLLIAVGHPALDLHGAADGIHHTRELGQEAIAGVLYDPALVLCDLGLDQFPEVGLEPLVPGLRLLASASNSSRLVCAK